MKHTGQLTFISSSRDSTKVRQYLMPQLSPIKKKTKLTEKKNNLSSVGVRAQR